MKTEWQPDCLGLERPHPLEVLRDPVLIDRESRVCEHLKDSWCSAGKAKLLFEVVVLTRPRVCVEIGAFTGSSTLPMVAGLEYVQSGHAHVIDAWSNDEAVRGLPIDDVNWTWWSAVDMSAARIACDRMIESWSLGAWCDVLPMASRQAVARVPAINFLHLDGNFSDEGARLDSESYLPNVVPGGYVLLSNALVSVAGKCTKMRALWSVLDRCDVICEIDGGSTILFRKR